MLVLVTCKNEEDSIKNGGNTVLKRLYVDFSDTQGQLTPQSVVDSAEIQSHPRFCGYPCYLQK